MNEEFKNLKEDSEIHFIKTKDKLQILIQEIFKEEDIIYKDLI
jgi:hypothetical protein